MHTRVSAIALLATAALWPGASPAESLTVLAGPIAPYAIENGDRPGAAVEVINAMAKRAGVDLVVKFEPWARAQTDTQSGKGVAILPLTRTSDRESRYAWIAPLLSDPLYLTTTRKDVAVPKLVDAKSLKIATLRDSAQEEELRHDGLSSNIEPTNDEDTGARMLKLGRVDAWFTRSMVASFTFSRNGGEPKDLVRFAETPTPPMYLAGSPDFPSVTAEKLRQALASLKADGTYDRIVGSYR